MSRKPSHYFKVALSASPLIIGLCATLTVGAVPANASLTLCQKVTPAKVAIALGLKVTTVRTVLSGATTTCWYNIGPERNLISIVGETGGTSTFKYDRSSSSLLGDHPVTDNHFAPYSAFSTKIGNASSGYLYGVEAVEKTNVIQISVDSARVSLAKIEALVRKVFALL